MAGKSLRKALGQKVYAKTDGVCWYCGKAIQDHPDEWHIEHVQPQRSGGSDEIWNLVPACARCNTSKGGRDIEEWRAGLRIQSADWPVYFSPKQIEFLEADLLVKLPLPESPSFWFETQREAPA